MASSRSASRPCLQSKLPFQLLLSIIGHICSSFSSHISAENTIIQSRDLPAQALWPIDLQA